MNASQQIKEDYRDLTEKHREGYIIKEIVGMKYRGKYKTARIVFSSKLAGRKVKIKLVEEKLKSPPKEKEKWK